MCWCVCDVAHSQRTSLAPLFAYLDDQVVAVAVAVVVVISSLTTRRRWRRRRRWRQLERVSDLLTDTLFTRYLQVCVCVCMCVCVCVCVC